MTHQETAAQNGRLRRVLASLIQNPEVPGLPTWAVHRVKAALLNNPESTENSELRRELEAKC